MDIYRRRQTAATASEPVFKPFKQGTRTLKKGFKWVGDGRIQHIKSGQVVSG